MHKVTLCNFDINNKKIHTFTSDFVSNHDYFLKEGYKLYVIYDKKTIPENARYLNSL